jgi:hypothetical protein
MHMWYSDSYAKFYCSFDLYKTPEQKEVKVTHTTKNNIEQSYLPKDAIYIGRDCKYIKSITLLSSASSLSFQYEIQT